MSNSIFRSDRKFNLICLIIGQLLFCLTTFYWLDDGRYSIDAGTIMFFSMLFWAIGFMGLFGLLKESIPIYSKLGLLYAMYGIFGGVAFALEGIFEEALASGDQIGVNAAELFPLQMNLVMFQSGPAFPLSFLVLGMVLAARKKVSWLAGILLSLGGVTFPLGRIIRMETVAHLTDLVLLVAVFLITFEIWNKGDE